jgi:anti-sigma B factor antagonist
MTRAKTSPAEQISSGSELRIESDLTIYTVVEWKETLLSALERSSALSIDLSAVRELDTAGLQLLLLAGREAQRAGKSITLVAPSTVVAEVVQLCNLDSQWNIQPAQQ